MESLETILDTEIIVSDIESGSCNAENACRQEQIRVGDITVGVNACNSQLSCYQNVGNISADAW